MTVGRTRRRTKGPTERKLGRGGRERRMGGNRGANLGEDRTRAHNLAGRGGRAGTRRKGRKPTRGASPPKEPMKRAGVWGEGGANFEPDGARGRGSREREGICCLFCFVVAYFLEGVVFLKNYENLKIKKNKN